MSPADMEALLDSPALKPPAGVNSNFDNPKNANLQFQIGICVSLGIVTIFTALQVFKRLSQSGKFFLDDYFIVISWSIYVALLGYTIAYVQDHGVFVHQWDMQVRDIPDFLKKCFTVSLFYAMIMIFLKAAIMIQWIRIFVPQGTRSWFYWALQAIMWFNTLFYVGCAIAEIFRCSPINKAWDSLMEEGRCGFAWDILPLASGVANVVVDLSSLIVPQKVIWGLQMSTSRKVGVSIIFAVGILSARARVWSVSVITNQILARAELNRTTLAALGRLYTCVVFSRSDDKAWWESMVSIWCLLEGTGSFLICTLPAASGLIGECFFIKPLISAISQFSKQFSKASSHGSSQMRERHDDEKESQSQHFHHLRKVPFSNVSHVSDETGSSVPFAGSGSTWTVQDGTAGSLDLRERDNRGEQGNTIFDEERSMGRW